MKYHHSFTLTLQKQAEYWQIGVAPFREDRDVVASFADKADADDAFDCINRALMARKPSWLLRGMAVIIFLAALFVVGTVLEYYFLKPAYLRPVTHSSSGGAVSAQPENGIPQPADEVLTPPH